MHFLKHTLLGLLGLGLSFASVAQNEVDALRYSGTYLTGTARSMGMAGAFSAVGADFSATTLNPAGLGLYRRNEFTFTPSFRVSGTESEYLSNTGTEVASNFGFGNIGYVYSSPVMEWRDRTKIPAQRGFKYWSFGFGFNQLANYRRNSEVLGYNFDNSISEVFAEQAQGVPESNIINAEGSYPNLAYYAFLINPRVGGTDGQWAAAVPGGNVNQLIQLEEKGRLNEWVASFAGNISDVVYVGATVGLRDLNFTHNLFLREDDVNNLHNQDIGDSTSFNYLQFTDYFRTRGSGINAKLGVLVRPVDFVRIGVSVETPTVYTLTDTYYAEVEGNFDNDATVYALPEDQNPVGTYSYRFKTPFKATAGAMVMLKKMGFLTADVEITDYGNTSFRNTNSPTGGLADFTDANLAIADRFSFSMGTRFGAEFRLNKFRLRGGFAQYGSVLRDEYLLYYDYLNGSPKKVRGTRRLITGGVGYKLEKFYIDLAFVNASNQDRTQIYTFADPTRYSPDLINKRTLNSLYLTTGFTF